MPTIKSGLTVNRPMSFAAYRNALLLGVNGDDRGIRWDGITGAAEPLGITAPTAALTIASSLTGAIAGTYTAYCRFVDDEGLVSDLAPLSNEITTTTATGTVTAATNATPIAVTTSAAHGLSTGNKVVLSGVIGNTAANGVWTITVTSTTTFTLDTSVGNGAYVGGGTWKTGAGQIDYSGIPTAAAADATRIVTVQIFRNTTGQSEVYYLDASVTEGTTVATSTKTDQDLRDAALTDPDTVLPLLNQDGTPFADRHGVPPTAARAVTVFQDRAFYLTKDDLYWSQPGLPESVKATDFLAIQQGDRDQDQNLGFMCYRQSMYVLQHRHVFDCSFVRQPEIDLVPTMVASRGAASLNSWCIAEGTAYLLDQQGVYAFDGSGVDSIDGPVQDYFRNGTVDWSQRTWFHGSYDPNNKIVRFHVAFSGDTRPKRALCYSRVTRKWWLEVYAEEIGGAVAVTIAGKLTLILGGTTGSWLFSGNKDDQTAVAWSWASGLFEFEASEEGLDREVRIIFPPTTGASSMTVQLFMNHEATARTPTGQYVLGAGADVTAGNALNIDMKKARSGLGDAPGFEMHKWIGRFNDEKQGDRYVKVRLAGSQSTDPISIYGLELAGVF